MLASSVPTGRTVVRMHPVLRVEQHDAELLDRPVAVLRQQELGDRPRAGDLHPLRGPPGSASGGPARPRPAPARLAPRRCPATPRELVVPRPCQAVDRRPRPRAPRWPDRARSPAPARGPSTIATSSLSPSAAGPSRCSFSRGRSCGATVFIVHHPGSRPAVHGSSAEGVAAKSARAVTTSVRARKRAEPRQAKCAAASHAEARGRWQELRRGWRSAGARAR